MTTTPETPAGGAPLAPPGARFDPVTGAELSAGAGAGGERRQSYALQPGEPVASFNLVTSLLPLASGSAPQTYRWALGVGILIPVVAGALGFLAFAFVAAARRGPGDLRGLHVRRQPVGGRAHRRGPGRDRGRRRARCGLHVPVARRDPRQQHLVVELRRQRPQRDPLVEPAGARAAGPDRRRGAQGGRARCCWPAVRSSTT